MPATPGSTQDLNQGRAEALQALLNSITQGDSSSVGEQKFTPDLVEKLSDKLGQFLGDGALSADIGGQRRNDKGELVNEEGLPIVDIVEPVFDNIATSATSQTANVFDDPDILPLWALSPAEMARRRAERERLFDVLEEEERLEKEYQEAADRERWRQELEKRKDAAKSELEAVRKAKELQKKMGKALLRNVIDAKEREEKEAVNIEKEERDQREERKKLKPQKSVTFADLPEDLEEQSLSRLKLEKQLGDLSLARLHRKGKLSLLTKAQMDAQPMKREIVERRPASLGSPPPPVGGGIANGDSDDESEPASPVLADSDEDEIIHSRPSEDERQTETSTSLPSSDSSDTEHMSDDEPVEWKEDDLDFARHQREIALAYYEKRAAIGSEASIAMRAHSHNNAEHDWDQPEVPINATLSSAPPRPTASRFKAKFASSSSFSAGTLPSHSLGSSVLPSSQSSGLRSAVKMGKLENGQLIGNGDDDDEAEAEAKAIIELLYKGEVTNIGPRSNVAPPSQTIRSGLPQIPASTLDQRAVKTESKAVSDPQVEPKPPQASKLRIALSRPHEKQESDQVVPASGTPRSVAESSSTKLTLPGLGTPISVPSSSSLPPRQRSNFIASTSPIPPQNGSTVQMPSMIVDSPSFLPPWKASLVASSPAGPPMIIDSPSHLSPQSASIVVDSPSFQSSEIDSPSFQYTTVSPAASSSGTNSDLPSAPSAGRPPLIMVADVKESKPAAQSSSTSTGSREKRVSRFMAERM